MPLSCLFCVVPVMSMMASCNTASTCPNKWVPICRGPSSHSLLYVKLAPTEIITNMYHSLQQTENLKQLKQATIHPLEGKWRRGILCECFMFLEAVQCFTDDCCLGSYADTAWGCSVIIMTSSNESVCSRRVGCQGVCCCGVCSWLFSAW